MKTPISRPSRTKKSGKTVPKRISTKPVLRVSSILVPIDFSDPSIKALSYAAALAEVFDAKLTLLYVSEPLVTPDFAAAFPLAMENDELLSAYKEKLSALAGKHSIDARRIEKCLVREGRAYREIAEAARTLKMDMIVISTHGYSGLNHVLLGSVAERVVRHSPCPVLVVRENEREFIPATK